MRFPPPQTEFRILAFDRNAKPGSPARRGRFTEVNGYPYLGRLCVRGQVIAEVETLAIIYETEGLNVIGNFCKTTDIDFNKPQFSLALG